MNTNFLSLINKESIHQVSNKKIEKALERNSSLHDSEVQGWLLVSQPSIIKFDKVISEIKELLEQNKNLEKNGDHIFYNDFVSIYNSIIQNIENIDFDSPASNQLNTSPSFRNYQQFISNLIYGNQNSKVIPLESKVNEALAYLALIQGRVSNNIKELNQDIKDAVRSAKELKNVENAIGIGKSLLSIDVKNTQKSVNKISTYYEQESKHIKESEKIFFRTIKRFYNFFWLVLSFLFLALILGIELIILWKQIDIKFYSLLPIYSILTIFILFSFKQYNRNIDLYNSYRFKTVSTEFMYGLLEFRKDSPNDSKLIIEKTLDKILEDPSSKKSNDSINLMTNNIKTPTSSS